jgi:hypothetical protein
MVLGMAMLITVIGVGALATARVTARQANVSSDWAEAGVIAFSAAEHAVARLNAQAAANPDTWRTNYTSGAVAFSDPFGRGTMKWVLVDGEGAAWDDGVLDDDYADTITLYAAGKIGKTTRVYSVKLDPGGPGLDVLRTACHSSAGIVLNGTTYVTNGPLSTNGTFGGDSYFRGGLTGVGAKEVVDSGGSGNGNASAKKMPSAGVFDTYKHKATPIAVSTSSIQFSTLSASSNPANGGTNDDGIYYIAMSGSLPTLTIGSSYIKGTLVVEGAGTAANQTLIIDGPTFWEPHNDGFAILITKGIKTVRIKGSMDPLSHSSGTKPSELRGVIHTIGTTGVELQPPAFIRGCLIAEGTVTVTSASGSAVGLTATPGLLTNPPLGYTTGTKVIPSRGSWDWAAPPAALTN